MKNKDIRSNGSCPLCGDPAKAATTKERCLRLPADAPNNCETMISHCIKSNELQQYFSSQAGEDPCFDCAYNEVIHTTGTFIGMKQLDFNSWAEVHKCPNCHCQYSFPSK